MIDRRKLLLGAVAGVVGTVAAKIAPAIPGPTADITSTTTTYNTTSMTSEPWLTSTTTPDPSHNPEHSCCWYWDQNTSMWRGCTKCEARTWDRAKRLAPEGLSTTTWYKV